MLCVDTTTRPSIPLNPRASHIHSISLLISTIYAMLGLGNEYLQIFAPVPALHFRQNFIWIELLLLLLDKDQKDIR